ncbi:MAG: ABC transporter permease subunit [Acidimicrobiia bacterium]
MQEILQFGIEGFPVGCVYALVAVGLVLTYKTSGVFNLAFGAQAFLSAAVFLELRGDRDWPLLPAFLVAVVVVGPLVGLILDRALFRYMRTASWMVKLATSLGLLVAIPEAVKIWFGQGIRYSPPSVAPLIGLDADRSFRSGDYNVSANEVVTIVATLAVVLGLGLLFRYTALGLQMRAVVESPRMVELAGVDSERVSMSAWMLSSFLAALSGVLIAPLLTNVDAATMTLLIVAAIAAAAFGKLTSIPLTLAGGLVLGIGQRVIAGELPPNSILAQGIRPALPFLLLFLLLVFLPALYKRREVGDPLAGVDPPAPAMAASYKDEQLRRFTRMIFPVFLAGFVFFNLFVLSDLWVARLTNGLVLAVIFLSITAFTGLSGQVSLGQAAFAGFGAAITGQLASQSDVPSWIGMLIGGAVAGLIGALLAIPALRLGGIFLALATLAFGLMAESIIFPLDGGEEVFGFHPNVFGGQLGINVPRPEGLGTDQAFFLFVFGVFAVVAILVILVRNGATGRFLAAMRGSETAAASIGINATRQRIIVFAFSAAIAGVGGSLLGMFNQRSTYQDWPTLIGVVWVVLVLTLGVRTVDGAVNAGMAFVLVQYLIDDLLHLPGSWFFILFGLGAITYARHPEGVVEFQTRKAIDAQVRGRRANQRATRLRREGRLPPQWRRVPTVVVPMMPLLLVPVIGYYFGAQPVLFGVLIGGPLLYSFWWVYCCYRDVHAHRRRGITGPLGLLIDLAGKVATFVLLPAQIARMADEDGRDRPIGWQVGRAPIGFVLAGLFLLNRSDTPKAAEELGLLVIALAGIVVFLRWVADVQAALNQSWLDIADPESARDEAEEEAPEAVAAPAALTAPAGGS